MRVCMHAAAASAVSGCPPSALRHYQTPAAGVESNGAGKTALMMAPLWALTGSVDSRAEVLRCAALACKLLVCAPCTGWQVALGMPGRGCAGQVGERQLLCWAAAALQA